MQLPLASCQGLLSSFNNMGNSDWSLLVVNGLLFVIFITVKESMVIKIVFYNA